MNDKEQSIQLLRNLVRWGEAVGRRAGVQMGDQLTGSLSEAREFLRKHDDRGGPVDRKEIRRALEEVTQDMPPEFAKLVNDHFWELLA